MMNRWQKDDENSDEGSNNNYAYLYFSFFSLALSSFYGPNRKMSNKYEIRRFVMQWNIYLRIFFFSQKREIYYKTLYVCIK